MNKMVRNIEIVSTKYKPRESVIQTHYTQPSSGQGLKVISSQRGKVKPKFIHNGHVT